MPRYRPNGGIIGPSINQSTGAPGVYTVPGQQQFNNAYQLEIYCWGAGGAGGRVGGWGYGASGGGAGAAYALLNATPGTVYTLIVGTSAGYGQSSSVGGGGSGCPNGVDNLYGGGGGGYSGVFASSASQANALLIAGGGGGGGSSRAGTGNAGGAGGGTNGGQGASPYDGKSSYGGGGGTQSAGGTATGGTSGSALQGGSPATNSYGGGGGGGYYGGAGGGYSESNTMGGGGGGSGYFKPSTFVSAILTAGSGATPGDSANSLRGSYGNPGAAGANNGTQGVIVFRYYGPQRGLGGTVTSSGGYTIHTITASGTYIC